MSEEFESFFERATRRGREPGFAPRAWQRALAVPVVCECRLLRVPTGFGKTLGVLLAWAYHRVHETRLATAPSEHATAGRASWTLMLMLRPQDIFFRNAVLTKLNRLGTGVKFTTCRGSRWDASTCRSLE